jgi:hypothetical protein
VIRLAPFAAFAPFAALALVACAHARTPAQYSADTGAAFASKDSDIQACYDKVLASAPQAAGKVSVTFAVEPKTGKVVDAKLDAAQTTAPQPVGQCVLDAIQTASITPGDRNRGQATWAWTFAPPQAH